MPNSQQYFRRQYTELPDVWTDRLRLNFKCTVCESVKPTAVNLTALYTVELPEELPPGVHANLYFLPDVSGENSPSKAVSPSE